MNTNTILLTCFAFVMGFVLYSPSLGCAVCEPQGTSTGISTDVIPIFCCSGDTITGVEVICKDIRLLGSSNGDSCTFSFGTNGSTLSMATVTAAEIRDSATNATYPGFNAWFSVNSPLWESLLGTSNTFSFVSEVNALGLDADTPVVASITFTFADPFLASDSSAMIDEIRSGFFGVGRWVAGNPDTAASGVLSICQPTSLPIELAYFDGRYLPDNGVQLLWGSWMELNFAYYCVERSMEGGEFEEIARIRGTGGEEGISRYEYTDNDLAGAAGHLEYRLRNLDINGEYSFSPTISVEYQKSTEVRQVNVFPVPAGESVTVSFMSFEERNATVQLFDLQGKLLRQESFITNTGINSVRIDLWDLGSGSYIMEVHGTDWSEKKFLLKT